MIFDDTKCQLGEGPLWHPTRNQFFWFDILNNRLHTKGQHWDFDTFVSAAGWIDSDTLMIASATALLQFDITTGAHVEICPLEADNPITRSNDGRADPQGGFWIGTMGINADDGAGAIYRYYKGELRQILAPITISNAICFAPDGKTAYFTDTPTQLVMQVSLDADGWPNAAPTVYLDLRGTDERPDGAVIDQNGNMWNAQWGLGRIAGYTADGRFLKAYDFPATQTTCPAFGGADRNILFCTSAAVGLTEGADHGKTFQVTTDIRGQAEHRVIL
ncbi:SMP-30/gluconolactonase/LRE family protein [Yoonia sp. I 8.24]|uniref:SMP-30/gluconolactonase/LRE family protein n=1 Tax=Yoonia sp. I 8.24 TaxID=1537229 RepID=UPI001EE133F0|nr:SMP-30/gluconolactonase/LRE family protein [Yoonia sp. I 8.24]MCG3266973.1 SMP-30/gluconolactonase/LRE family protein [Yoonia sp. I 8.24]